MVIENVMFTKYGFADFLEALTLAGLISGQHSPIIAEGYLTWDDSRKLGGIKLNTSVHPMVYKTQPVTLTLEGVATALAKAKPILDMYTCLCNH